MGIYKRRDKGEDGSRSKEGKRRNCWVKFKWKEETVRRVKKAKKENDLAEDRRKK